MFSYSASVDQAAILDTRKRNVLNLDRHFKRTVSEFIINRYIVHKHTYINASPTHMLCTYIYMLNYDISCRLKTQRASSVQTTLASIQSSYQELELMKLAANEMLGKDSLLHKVTILL